MSRPYPLDATSRAKLRAEARTDALERAEHAAAGYGLSINCLKGVRFENHPLDEPGCRNTGDGCLCPCHDRKEADR